MSLAHQIMPAGEQPVPSLIRYDAACRALAEAKSVDDVKDIRDRSEAIRAYARQAKNKQLEVDAAEIRIRAERRLGEMITAQKAAVGLSEGGRPKKTPSAEEVVFSKPSLAEAGIDHKLSARAQKMAAVPAEEFESLVGEWRERVEAENERVTTNLLKAGERAEQGRRENDFYPTPESLIAEITARWVTGSTTIWEPCAGDGRVVQAFRDAGYEVIAGDITQGNDFFSCKAPPSPNVALCTNPPFERVREFIYHAFAIGIRKMCLVLPERIWASGVGREQFERHRPAVWVNLDWREDYLGKGGSPDRALAVAMWDGPCAQTCRFEVWTRQEDAQEITESNQATGTGGEDVDRSAERASSGVEVGANNSPERATDIGIPIQTGNDTTLAAREADESAALNPVANVGEGANGAIAAASDDPASRDADGADRQQPAASGFTGEDDGRDVEAAGGAAPVITNSHSAPITPQAAEQTGAVPVLPAAPVAPPATLSKADQMRQLRPHCQHPGTDLCGGSGRNHCHACKKLMAEGEAA